MFGRNYIVFVRNYLILDYELIYEQALTIFDLGSALNVKLIIRGIQNPDQITF